MHLILDREKANDEVVQQKIDDLRIKLKTDFNNKFERQNWDFNRIWQENLLVPDLIGPNHEPYKNLVELL